VGFSQLICRYKLTFTVTASWFTTRHNRVVNRFCLLSKLLL
jgi:hypothetical protein